MQRAPHAHWQLDDLTGMVTTEEYFPTFSIEEARVVKRLVLEERHFYKPLPYDGAPTRFPNFLLTDCGEATVPLEIVTGNVADAATRRLRIAEYEANQQRYWLWDASERALPPTLLEPAA